MSSDLIANVDICELVSSSIVFQYFKQVCVFGYPRRETRDNWLLYKSMKVIYPRVVLTAGQDILVYNVKLEVIFELTT